MSDPFVAEIRIVGFNFAPTGWAQCNGQLIPIAQNTALFSLLGTFYGGDGRSTFALPNFQGSGPIGTGQSPGGSNYPSVGQQSGVPYITLLTSEIPVHTHSAMADATGSNLANTPVSNDWAKAAVSRQGINNYNSSVGSGLQMNFQALSIAGGSQPHNNMQPYLVLNFIIAMQGVFPPRS